MFFENRPFINKDGAVALKDNQHLNITRAIWFYRIDPAHTFHGRNREIRYNVLGFLSCISKSLHQDHDVTKVAFMKAFVLAYWEDLRRPLEFIHREHFIELWKASPYDLLEFRSGELKALNRTFKALRAQLKSYEESTRKRPDETDEQWKIRMAPLRATRWIIDQIEAARQSAQLRLPTGITDYRNVVSEEARDVPWEDPISRVNSHF
jgi:hypothetical protein